MIILRFTFVTDERLTDNISEDSFPKVSFIIGGDNQSAIVTDNNTFLKHPIKLILFIIIVFLRLLIMKYRFLTFQVILNFMQINQSF